MRISSGASSPTRSARSYRSSPPCSTKRSTTCSLLWTFPVHTESRSLQQSARTAQRGNQAANGRGGNLSQRLRDRAARRSAAARAERRVAAAAAVPAARRTSGRQRQPDPAPLSGHHRLRTPARRESVVHHSPGHDLGDRPNFEPSPKSARAFRANSAPCSASAPYFEPSAR